MASLIPLTLGFAHVPDRPLPSSLGLPAASYFIRESKLLAVGYTSGVIILLETSEDGTCQRPRSYLSGHETSIVAFESIAIRSPTGKDDIVLLSLALDGSLRKWDAADGRCLQSADAAFDARPRGMAIVPIPAVNAEGKPLEFNWLTDYYVLVHGCSTSISIVSLATLSTSSLWTGHRDWPILLSIPGASHNTVFTVEKEGALQPWTLAKKPPRTIETTKVQETPLSIGDKRLGDIVDVILFTDPDEDDQEKVLVIQKNGLSIYRCVKTGGIRLTFLHSVDEVSKIRSAAVEGQFIICFLQGGSISVYNSDDLEALERIPSHQSPDYRVLLYAASESPTGSTQITGLGVTNSGANAIVTGSKASKRDEFHWNKPDSKPTEGSLDASTTSTASALFEYAFVFAMGNTLNFYTLDQFLLDLSSPNHSIALPDRGSRVSILQAIHLPKTAASEETTYLVVGLINGCIQLIEPESFQVSACLCLHSGPIAGALVLPADLAPRIRSTLLVYSENGSASIVDIIPSVSETSPFKIRTLLTLPCGMAPRKLTCVATQKGKNLLLLVDNDGRKRLWDVDAGDGGSLVSDNESSQSATSRDNQYIGDFDSSKEPWQEHQLGDLKSGPLGSPTSIVHDGKSPSAHGYPTATVDIFAIIRYLHKRAKGTGTTAEALPLEEGVLLPARSLLTVLVDYLGVLNRSLPQDRQLELQQLLVEGCESKISIAQVDPNGNIAIAIRDTSKAAGANWADMSLRTRTQIVVAICSIVYAILHLTAVSEAISDGDSVLKRTATLVLEQRRGSKGAGLDLELLSEFWADSNPWIRESCRILLQTELSLLKQEEVKLAMEYWQDFLPTQIAPELFSSKDVLKSVIVLSVIITSLDEENTSGFKVDRGLRRNVALSIELFLTDSDKTYQDAAIDLVSEGWLSWQSEFDAFEVIHILMRILASQQLTPERITKINNAFIKIAQKNAPLLASGLANCICHAAPEKGVASTTLTELVNLSIAAKKTVISIVRADPCLFAEPEIIKVVMDAVVKILDPQGGQIRERVLQHVSEVVNEVVDAYPTVAFHRPSQRLAISASPRTVTIYDLNTAKPVVSLEGQTKTVQFVTFSGDGKTVVAVDLDDSQVLVWKIAVSIFSSFIGAAANIGVLGAEGAGVITAKSKYGFKNSKGVGVIRIEFKSERTVRITAGADVTLVNI
ncbi:hypothetical protein DRE_03888 [Drechslerella stenobrocha 248]|uniref:Uncharacterized protein n=1 Tax=Drechslerella stenobrocha 248 TaxID=1043628 RepID=W7HS15_9PEZI|nr:hypothetical protein DRE_03888 [Drechslerella stenobrocha 248]